MNARARKVRKTMPDKIECMNPIGACTDGTMAAHGKGGIYRGNLRHGVSRLRSGHRRAEGSFFMMWPTISGVMYGELGR